MAVRPAGALRLGRRVFGPAQLLVMAVVDPARDPDAAMQRVHAVVAEGADIVAVAAGADGAAGFVAATRDRYPELVVGVSAESPEVAREACAAGADLLSWSGPTLPSGPVGPVGPVEPVDLVGPLGPLDSWGSGGFGGFGGFGLAEVAAEAGAGMICPPGLAARAVAAGVEPERIVLGADSVAGLGALVATGRPVLVSLPGEDLAGSLATAAVGAWLGARVFGVPWTLQARRALRMVSAIRGDIPPARAVRGLGLFLLQVPLAGCGRVTGKVA